tara:strand:+ start:89 stop:493 length:405 start_codon:yes stop_codon:yes gene_type:complete
LCPESDPQTRTFPANFPQRKIKQDFYAVLKIKRYIWHMQNATNTELIPTKLGKFEISGDNGFAGTLKQGNITIELSYSPPFWTAIWMEGGKQLPLWQGGKFPAQIGNYCETSGRLIKGSTPFQKALNSFAKYNH